MTLVFALGVVCWFTWNWGKGDDWEKGAKIIKHPFSKSLFIQKGTQTLEPSRHSESA